MDGTIQLYGINWHGKQRGQVGVFQNESLPRTDFYSGYIKHAGMPDGNSVTVIKNHGGCTTRTSGSCATTARAAVPTTSASSPF
jgi:hypothetical protein